MIEKEQVLPVLFHITTPESNRERVRKHSVLSQDLVRAFQKEKIHAGFPEQKRTPLTWLWRGREAAMSARQPVCEPGPSRFYVLHRRHLYSKPKPYIVDWQEMIPIEFFNRDAEVVARELLGKFLIVKQGDCKLEFMIKETEAYVGPHDLACHASKGKTKRTEVMYGEAGTIYMYLIYGMYWMLNIVTGERDYPAAVLIRSAGEYDGPGKLTRALALNGSYNNKILGKDTRLWIEEGVEPKEILTTPRIGIDYAGEWRDKPLRFVLHA